MRVKWIIRVVQLFSSNCFPKLCLCVYIIVRFGGGTEHEDGLVIVSARGLEVSVDLTVEAHLGSLLIYCAITCCVLNCELIVLPKCDLPL